MEIAESALTFSSLSTLPVYNVKAVCKRTGLTSATLRAWERRYGLPQPDRSNHGYRVYSERDLAILFWLRRQTASGINIGHAVRQLEALLNNGHDPHVPILAGNNVVAGLRSPDILRSEMVVALLALEERTAEHLLSEALAIYTLETALIGILQNAVRDVREMRQQDKISTTAEHLALTYAHQRLLNMAQASPIANTRRKSVMTVGFSSEHVDIDLLIMTILLRRQGIPVTNLGSDLEPKMLEHTLEHFNVGMVVFYADDPKNVIRLVGLEMPHAANKADDQEAVQGVICGRALETAPELKAHITLEYMGADLRDAIRKIAAHMLSSMAHEKPNAHTASTE